MSAERRMGITFYDLLGVLFIGLKLAGCIDWSWFCVLIPFYVEAAAVLVGLLVGIIEKRKERRVWE